VLEDVLTPEQRKLVYKVYKIGAGVIVIATAGLLAAGLAEWQPLLIANAIWNALGGMVGQQADANTHPPVEEGEEDVAHLFGDVVPEVEEDPEVGEIASPSQTFRDLGRRPDATILPVDPPRYD
jgi:hypothetical protein